MISSLLKSMTTQKKNYFRFIIDDEKLKKASRIFVEKNKYEWKWDCLDEKEKKMPILMSWLDVSLISSMKVKTIRNYIQFDQNNNRTNDVSCESAYI